jgi:quercetin dioxygenase-like cupin family protein
VFRAAKLVEHVEIKRIEFAPGQASGPHRHPCPVVGYVATGAIKFQIDGEAVQNLRQGDAFFEPQDVRIAHFDNASTSEPAAFIAFYLLGAAENELIEMLE